MSLLFSLFCENNKSTDNNLNYKITKAGIKVYKKWSPEIKQYNNIVRSSYKKEHLKNCDIIKDNSLKNNCISKIKAKIKFPANVILSGKCDIYKNNRDKDICLFNYYIRSIKDNSYKKKCLNISKKSIQNLCIARIKLKLSK